MVRQWRLTAFWTLTDADNLLSEGDIAASNVRPAFEVSLAHGASEAELAAIGWVRAQLERDGASVTGASTYRHMELMFAKSDYAGFVLAAVATHTLSSLGVVGLACKTAPSLGAALACHQRYQHLTNRSARYTTQVVGERLILAESRPDPSLGSQLISDYTLLIALALLRSAAAVPLEVRALRSRRAELCADERARYEAFAGVRIETGAAAAALEIDAAVLEAPVAGADPELAAYFQAVLDRAGPLEPADPPLVQEVRGVIRDRLPHTTPTSAAVAKHIGLGQRTLQRRLATLDLSFAEVLEDTRARLARGYLRDPSLALAEIAYLLGYAEQASFFRAFRRWEGTTPAAYRRAL